MATSKTKLYGMIDRFEGDFAVVLMRSDDERIDIKKKLLPFGTGEGDLLEITLKSSKDRTKKAKDDVEGMISELKKKSTSSS